MAERAGEAGSKEVAARLQAAAELAHSTGLAGPARSGVLVFNGVVSTNDGGSGWHGVTMGAVQSQLQQVQEDVYMQRLTDAAVDIYEGEWASGVAGVAGVMLGCRSGEGAAEGEESACRTQYVCMCVGIEVCWGHRLGNDAMSCGREGPESSYPPASPCRAVPQTS